jgi:hypothetical protein
MTPTDTAALAAELDRLRRRVRALTALVLLALTGLVAAGVRALWAPVAAPLPLPNRNGRTPSKPANWCSATPRGGRRWC